MKGPLARCLLLTVVLFAACSPKPVRVDGTAMLPAFADGDRVLMDQNVGELKRGDVIMFLYPKDHSKWYIKRIVGLPGDIVEFRGGQIFINGEKLDEPYVDEEHNQTKANFPPKKVSENNYYVLGDNRDNSSDSRYWGTVDRNLIKGKYTMTYAKAQK